VRAPALITALTALLLNTAVAQAPSPWKWGPAPPSIPPGRTIVQVHGMGPFALTYVNAADDPQKKQAP